MGEIGAAVFDLGGVVIDWDPRHLYRDVFAGDEGAMEEFLATVCTTDWNAEQDLGRPFAEGIAALSAEHPDQADLIELYWTRWGEMLDGPIPGTGAVLRELRASGIPLYALTNWSAETFPLAQQRFECLELFDGIVVSGREGMAKPDPGIFGVLCERYELKASECLFVDDSATNVKAAETFGFSHCVLFTTADDLRRRLPALGLLP